MATDPHSYYYFKVSLILNFLNFFSKLQLFFKNEGHKGPLTQTSASDLDPQTDVLFLTQLNRDAVACWNTKKPLNPDNFGLVTQDHEGLIFTNDLKVGL